MSIESFEEYMGCSQQVYSGKGPPVRHETVPKSEDKLLGGVSCSLRDYEQLPPYCRDYELVEGVLCRRDMVDKYHILTENF